MEIEQNLVKWGLTSKEAQVYNALVESIESTVFNLAQTTKIPRTTVYEVLDSLSERGLVSYSRKNGVKYFSAESPNNLLRILEDKMQIAKQIIPILLATPSKKGLSPKVKFYIGEEGKKKALDDIADTCEKTVDKKFFAISGTSLPQEIPSYLAKWIKRKEALGITSQMIAWDSPGHIAPKIYPNNKYREVRLIPAEFVSESSFDLYYGKVVIFSQVDGIDHSIIIESPSIYEGFKKFFDFMWLHGAKSVNAETSKD